MDKTMHSIQGYLVSRQSTLKNFFKDFDKLCTVYITNVLKIAHNNSNVIRLMGDR